MGHRKTRLLVIAEACNPEWTSVPLVGYNLAAALTRRSDLEITIATHPRNREAIEGNEISQRAEFIYPDNEYVAGPIYRTAQLFRGNRGKGWTTNTAFAWLSYIVFERELHRMIREDAKDRFDIMHRVTPVTPTVGSPIAKWLDLPMVIGPLNGGLPWPKAYPELRRKENEFLVPLRRLYTKLPYYRSSYANIKAAIAGSQHTATELPSSFCGERYVIPENGVDPDKFEIHDRWTPPRERFRFITVGRLVPYKGLWLTLKAMNESSLLRHCELVVIGDGPERPNLERLVAEYSLSEQVKFLGWLGQEQAAAEMRASQAFVFPSLREFGGGVVLEAMSSGLPSIIVGYGGPLDLISERSGVLLPMQPEIPMVHDLRHAMEKLVEDHDLCRQLSANAVEEIRQKFTWDAKADQIVQIYEKVLGLERCNQTQERELATLA